MLKLLPSILLVMLPSIVFSKQVISFSEANTLEFDRNFSTKSEFGNCRINNYKFINPGKKYWIKDKVDSEWIETDEGLITGSVSRLALENEIEIICSTKDVHDNKNDNIFIKNIKNVSFRRRNMPSWIFEEQDDSGRVIGEVFRVHKSSYNTLCMFEIDGLPSKYLCSEEQYDKLIKVKGKKIQIMYKSVKYSHPVFSRTPNNARKVLSITVP